MARLFLYEYLIGTQKSELKYLIISIHRMFMNLFTTENEEVSCKICPNLSEC